MYRDINLMKSKSTSSFWNISMCDTSQRTVSSICHVEGTISISLLRIIMQFITCYYSEQNWLFKIICLLNKNSEVVFKIIFN